MDVYIAVARVAKERGFAFASVCPGERNVLKIKGAFHPFLKKPKGNTLEVDENSNVIFLTGANMAGKSTFMKTFSIAIFLAHVGFPVPAEAMEFSVRNGMFTTINLPDNLSMGYSHFYAEVLRLKKVVMQLQQTKKLVIVFDELFRGTNVKDAYDATLAVTEAFAGVPDCLFLISTHIIEVGVVLKERCKNIRFVYLPTKMEGGKPVYTYQLTEGITNDRHGMIIINNEKIIDIINGEGGEQ
jgi:putative mismatch repair-like protein